jgi:hypothetical protein
MTKGHGTMSIAHIEGATRVLGVSQGYLGLPLRDDIEFDKASGENVHTMTTAWQPNPRQMAAIAKGATIYLTLFGINHPPCRIEVGPEPDGE